MPRNKSTELFVDGIKNRVIVDQDRKPVSIEKAKQLWKRGSVGNYNLSFKRLATVANWDWEELERQYAEMDMARGLI